MATREEYYWQKMAHKYPNDPQYEQFPERPIVHSDCCDVLIDDDNYNSEVCPKCDRSCELVEQGD